MSETLLQVRHLAKRFGGFVALAGIELHVGAGERVGLIGPNGSGKSTLVNCICGTLVNDRGSVFFDGRDLGGLAPHRRTRLGLVRTFQIPKPFGSMSVVENLSVPLIYAIHGGAGPRPHR
ncbi:MAG TPA: ATP-binding cassette domain-containing protein, partial [Candidatus Cybelea sp.]|nr:ATP-binding cassette domain-containing protein [Candidatus Cybelea sp.]